MSDRYGYPYGQVPRSHPVLIPRRPGMSGGGGGPVLDPRDPRYAYGPGRYSSADILGPDPAVLRAQQAAQARAMAQAEAQARALAEARARQVAAAQAEAHARAVALEREQRREAAMVGRHAGPDWVPRSDPMMIPRRRNPNYDPRYGGWR